MRCWIVAAGLAAACTGVAVDPRELAADLPPPVELAIEARQEAERLGARALAQATAGAVAEARAAADAALAIDPRQARALATLGVVAMQEAQAEHPPALPAWRRAEGELLRARALAPSDPEVALALARFYVADGHGRAALAVLDEALARDPRHVPLLRLAGVVTYEASEERRARSYLMRLVELTPDDASSVYRLAQCEAVLAERPREEAARRQAWQQAAAWFARYRVLAPDDAQGILGEAQARFRLWELAGEPRDPVPLQPVRELYQIAGSRAPRLAEPVYGEGVVCEAMADLVAAEAAYREALRRQPAHVPSMLNLAALLAARGEAGAARVYWEKAMAAGLTPDERRKVTALLAR